MTSRVACTWLTAVMTFTGLTIACGPAAQDDAASPGQKLRVLLQKRCDTLNARLRVLEQKRQLDMADLDAVLSARIDVLDAELELATTKAERIEVLKKRVQNFRELEEWKRVVQRAPRPPALSGRRVMADDSADEALWATAARMQAEIDLLREELNTE